VAIQDDTGGWRVASGIRALSTRERLASQLADWHQFVTTARLPDDEEAADNMSPQELERLRSRGYIQ